MQTAAAPEEENKMSKQPSVHSGGCFFDRFRQKRSKMQRRSSPHAERSAASEHNRAHLQAEIPAACALLTKFLCFSQRSGGANSIDTLQKTPSALQNAAFMN